MIIGIIHKGSGLGDQLFTYIATRVRVLDLGVEFGFVGKEFFKGEGWIELDWGNEVDLKYHIEEPAGKLVIDTPHKLFEVKTESFDPEFNFIEDGTVIDATDAQDIKYFKHREKEMKEWLKVQRYIAPDNLCVLNIRGGEYMTVSDLFLPKEYWEQAIKLMKEKYPDIKFEIHTDDLELAQKWFPDILAIKNIEFNWRSIRYAKHLIISNSAFAIIPALLNEQVKEVIAPKGWAGRNIRIWRRPQNYYRKFFYI